jgi:O-acetyl-ADP-ribose deacetylase (regulator of RNase III)
MKVIEGDLIEYLKTGNVDVLVHGCNCFCTMGSGFAKQIKEHFPLAYIEDNSTKYGDKSKLGGYTFAPVNVFIDERNNICKEVIIVNAYTQYFYGEKHTQFDYGALTSVMRAVARSFKGHRIAYPKIGAGLGKGDWDIISKIIDKELEGIDHTLVVLP